jgi:hypothetical protein
MQACNNNFEKLLAVREIQLDIRKGFRLKKALERSSLEGIGFIKICLCLTLIFLATAIFLDNKPLMVFGVLLFITCVGLIFAASAKHLNATMLNRRLLQLNSIDVPMAQYIELKARLRALKQLNYLAEISECISMLKIQNMKSGITQNALINTLVAATVTMIVAVPNMLSPIVLITAVFILAFSIPQLAAHLSEKIGHEKSIAELELFVFWYKEGY